MAYDITTTLNTLLNRATESSIDFIAKDGLKLLKSVLDNSGFADSPYLKDYRIYAHVSGSVITFEIVISLEALDEESKKEVESSEEEEEESSGRTYGYMSGIIGRMYALDDSRRDARTPLRDARTSATSALNPSRDARRTSNVRSVLRQVRNASPRSIQVRSSGKVSVKLKNYVQEKRSEVIIPTQKYHGVVSEFVGRLSSVVSSNFAPKLVSIISRRF